MSHVFKDIQTIEVTVSEVPALKNAITNILMTPKGSLPGRPDFGSDIGKLLFSQLDALHVSLLKNYIRESLSEFEPRITLTKINVKNVEEFNKIVIDIYFTYKNINGAVNDSTSIVVQI